jgi:hypothetical protein
MMKFFGLGRLTLKNANVDRITSYSERKKKAGDPWLNGPMIHNLIQILRDATSTQITGDTVSVHPNVVDDGRPLVSG